MFRKFSDEDMMEVQKREEYERLRQQRLAKGVGGFFMKAIVYSFIFLLTYLVIALVLLHFFPEHEFLSYLISMISGLAIFKIRYTKENSFKSLGMLVFIFFLELVLFDVVRI